jgi:hypothetical protein
MNAWSLAAALVLGGLSIGAQDKASKAETAAEANAVYATAVTARVQGKRVSASFNQASVREVLDWLTKNGMNFVVSDSEIPRDATVTLNVQDQPVNEVADAIAEALGGHWANRSGLRVFRKGVAPMTFGRDGQRWNFTPHPDTFGPDVKGFAMPDVKVFSKFKDLSEKDRAKLHKELRESLKDIPKISEKTAEEIERHMREFRGPEGEKMRIEIRKDMERAREEIDRVRKEHPEAFDRVWVMPEGRDLPRMREFVQPDVRVFSRQGRELNALRSKVFRSDDMDAFVRSLTPVQLDKHRRMGYLSPRDLTEKQRKQLGVDDWSGKWSITYSSDDKSITIKND